MGIGLLRSFYLFQLGLDLVQQRQKVSSQWCKFDFQLFGDGGDLGLKGNDDVFADVSDDLHGLSDHCLDFGFVFGNELVHLFLSHFQVLANDGLNAWFDVLQGRGTGEKNKGRGTRDKNKAMKRLYERVVGRSVCFGQLGATSAVCTDWFCHFVYQD